MSWNSEFSFERSKTPGPQSFSRLWPRFQLISGFELWTDAVHRISHRNRNHANYKRRLVGRDCVECEIAFHRPRFLAGLLP